MPTYDYYYSIYMYLDGLQAMGRSMTTTLSCTTAPEPSPWTGPIRKD